jgi:hypothetical protein
MVLAVVIVEVEVVIPAPPTPFSLPLVVVVVVIIVDAPVVVAPPVIRRSANETAVIVNRHVGRGGGS